MRVLAAVLPLLAVVSAAHGSSHSRHRRVANTIDKRVADANIARSNEAHAQAVRVIKRKVRQRGQTCRPRKAVPDSAGYHAAGLLSGSSSSTSAASTTSTASADPTYSAAPAPSSYSESPSWSEAPAPTAAPAPPAPQPDHGGSYGINDARCGWSNAGPDTPNGSEDWLNCGVNSGGWTPPFLGLQDVKAAPLTADGIFAPCADYLWAFEQYGGEFGSRFLGSGKGPS